MIVWPRIICIFGSFTSSNDCAPSPVALMSISCPKLRSSERDLTSARLNSTPELSSFRLSQGRKTLGFKTIVLSNMY